jgi:GT2 family glycosyltransferase
MPVHNAVRFVGEAVRSVLDDLPADGEVVIVDDGSSDGSSDVIAELARLDTRVTVVRNESPTGVSNALNHGITHPGCPEYVGIAEHDDVVVEGRFEQQLAALRDDPALGAVSGEGRYLGPSGRIAGRATVGPKTDEEFDQMRQAGREILIPHPAILYRRDAIVQAGLYDPAFDSAQDLEIVNRLVYAAGWRVRTLRSVHVLYRIHDSSMSFSHISEQRMITRYIKYRNAAQLSNTPWTDYQAWKAVNQPDRWTRWTWFRKDTGALRYRQAGLAWLNRQPVTFAGNLLAACVLHPRWVLMKLGVAVGRH